MTHSRADESHLAGDPIPAGPICITIVQGPFLPVPPMFGGAVERIMWNLGQEWARQGATVTHISRRFGNLPAEEQVSGVRHLRIPSANQPKSRLLFRFLEALYCWRARRALPDGDIVLANSALFPFFLRTKKKGRLVLRMGRPPKGQLRFFRHLDLVQTISADMVHRILAEAPWLKGRVSLVGSPLAANLTPLSDSHTEQPRDALITFVGRLHPEKGLELLLEAFLLVAARFPQWRLQVIGPSNIAAGGGGEAYHQRLEELAARLPGQIILRRPIFDTGQLASELKRSELFAYPSLAENGEALGLAPIEAASQGAIPILSDLACFRDFAKDNVNALMFDHRGPGAVECLAQVLERAMSDSALRQSLRPKTLQAARTYQLEGVAARHLADYRRLLAGEKLDF